MKKLGLLVMPLMAMSLLASCNKGGGGGGGDDSLKTPMHFTCLSDTATVTAYCKNIPIECEPKVEYSMDGTDWKQVEFEIFPENKDTKKLFSSFKLEKDQKIYFRSDIENIPTTKMNFIGPMLSSTGEYTKDGELAVSGNIMSIYKSTEFENAEMKIEGCLNSLFYLNKNLVDASKLLLPATTLTKYCYDNLFHGCSNLTTAPELPATTLAEGCYANMFEYCHLLTSAPKALPATQLANYCYSNMFEYCTALKTAPFIAGTNTNVESPYSYMFKECTKLNYVKVAFGTPGSGEWPCQDPKDFTLGWLKDVAENGTFVWKGSTDVASRSEDTIPENWTITNVD